jgi:hypothetical protein
VPNVLQAKASWIPSPLPVSPGIPTTVKLIIENTGNLETVFQLALDVAPGISAALLHPQVPLPPGGTVRLPVVVNGDQVGMYTISAAVTSGATPFQVDLLVWVGSQFRQIYLPEIYQ